MANVSKRKLSKEGDKLVGESLLEVLADSKSKRKVDQLLRGLVTKVEEVMLGKRLLEELLLLSGWEVFGIADRLTLSAATV